MNIDNAIKYSRTSLWGIIYFAHYKRIEYPPPRKVDSCFVRKIVFFLAPWSWFIRKRVLDTRVKPWVFAAITLFAILSFLYPVIVAWIVTPTLMLAAILAAIIAVVVVFLFAWFGTERVRDEIARRIISVLDVFDTLLGHIGSLWEKTKIPNAWEWFTFQRAFDIVPLWTMTIVILVAVVHVYAYFAGVKWLLSFILIVEGLTVLVLAVLAAIVIIIVIYNKLDELDIGYAVTTGIGSASARIGRTPIANRTKSTLGILADWFRDFKDRVCKPVVWVNGN